MTTGNTNTLNSANENIRRQAETPEARRERLRRRLLSEVLEERIHRGEWTAGKGLEYYDRVKSESGYLSIRADMRSYLASADPETLDDALREITPAEIAELVSGIPDDDIRHTLMRYGASIESDREAALERIKGEYSLVPADFQTIRGFIATASREDLTAMAKNKAARKRVIQTKAHVNLEGRDRNIASILDEIGLNQVSKPLNDTDKALIRRLMYPGGGDVRFVSSADVKRLFQILDFTNAANRNAKSRKALRNLFRAYCPMIRTGTLRKSGLLTPETVRSIREAIIRHQPGDMEATFGSYIMGINLTEEEIVRHDSIAIPFDQIADSTIDRLIDAENSDLFEAIAKDLTDERKPDQPHESGELGERDPHDWLIESEDERPGRDNSSVPESLGLYEYLNDHGQLVPRLAARIKKLFPHVTGTERIGDDTFVMGKIRDKKTGKESSVYIQIHEAFSGWFLSPTIRIQSRGIIDAIDLETDTSGDTVEELDYNEFITSLGSLDSAEIIDRTELDRRLQINRNIESGQQVSDEDRKLAVADYVPSTNIRTIHELARHLNEIDSTRSVTEFGVGSSFDFGNPKRPDGYETFSVTAINEPSSLITINDGAGNSFTVSFTEFYAQFSALKAARFSDPLNTADGVVKTLGSELSGNKSDAWRKIAYANGEFRDSSSVGDGANPSEELKKPFRFFQQGDTLVEIVKSAPGYVTFVRHEGFTPEKVEKDKVTPATSKKAWRYERVGYEKLYQVLRTYECEPTRLSHEIGGIDRKFDIQEEWSPIKGLFKNKLSIRDIIGAFKQGSEYFNNKLEKNDTINQAKLLSSVFKHMPDWLFSEADKLKLKSQLHGEVEKKIDEVKGMLEKSMSGLDRRKLTEKMLLNRNTKMPELMGAMLVTLEKWGGMLYAEPPLSKYEWTGLWFKRFAGLPPNCDHTKTQKWKEYYQEAMDFRDSEAGKQLNLSGEVTEIEIIWTWARKVEKDGDATFIPNFGPRVFRAWAEWRQAETEKGKREADNYGDPGKRLTYALNKAREGLWYCAMGDYNKSGDGAAMQSIINKGWDDYLNGAFPFVAIMGNASKMVPIGVFNKLRVSMAMGGKYTYPPFMFMKNHDDMKLFRRVVEKLIAKHGSQKAKELVQKIAYIRDEHPGATYDGQPVNQILVDLTHQLWKDHWRDMDLMQKLNVFRDRTLIAERHNDPDFDRYIRNMEWFYSDSEWSKGSAENESERQNEVYAGNHTPPRVDVIAKWIHFSDQTSGMDSKSSKLWTQVLSHLDMIKTLKDPRVRSDDAQAEAKHDLYRKKLFAEYQHAIAKEIMDETNQHNDYTRTQKYAKELIEKYGFDETLFVPEMLRTHPDPEKRVKELREQREPLEILEFDSYQYAEDGAYDRYVSEPGINAIEKRSFQDRFNTFMGRSSTTVSTGETGPIKFWALGRKVAEQVAGSVANDQDEWRRAA